MLDFFQSPVTQTVLIALNQGFLVTLELFFVTLIGALPLGLVIAFGSMNRWTPLSRPPRGGLRPPGPGPRTPVPAFPRPAAAAAAGQNSSFDYTTRKS